MNAGDMRYQILARQALPILVRQAQNRKTVTYGNLALELKMSNHRNLGFVLGSICTSIEKLAEKWGGKIPPIQSLVVRKDTGLPGDGIAEFLGIENVKFAKLPSFERKKIQNRALDDISLYQRWREVLKALNLMPLQADSSLVKKAAKVKTSDRFSGGGEGKQHKALKEYVANHPEILGLGAHFSNVDTEKGLASGDLLDVSFMRDANNTRNAFAWVAVEVKSAISSEIDILRGIFQCVKYKAVMKAETKFDGKPPNIRVVLILEKALPPLLIPAMNALGVEVMSNISPAKEHNGTK